MRSIRATRSGLLAAAALAIGAGLVAGVPSGALAQSRAPIDPMIGQYDRQLRSIQGQAATDPAGAAQSARQLRGRITTDNGGVAFDRERARIDRQLGQIQDTTAAPQPDAPDARPLEPLPSSVGQEDPSALPGTLNQSRLVGRLLDRAQQGIADRDSLQARSDIESARASLDGLHGAMPAADVKQLSDRLDGLSRRVDRMPAPEAE